MQLWRLASLKYAEQATYQGRVDISISGPKAGWKKILLFLEDPVFFFYIFELIE